MPLLDVPLLARLQEEFRLSMKRLLGDLCLDLEGQYADVAKSLALPVAYFRFLGQALERDAYAHWKVVGWIEALNDLVYFIDLLQQIREEQNPREFAAQLFAECEEKFFENSYLDDLFPRRVSQASGLERRLNALCTRLTQELTQESLCLVPGLPMLWCASRKIPSWTIEVHLDHNVERAEMFGTMAVGMEGAIYEAPHSVKRALKQASGQATILVQPKELSLKIGRTMTPLCMRRGNRLEWSWMYRSPVVATETRSEAVTVGPTLVYGKDRQPRTVASTSADQIARIGRAWTIVQEAWPEGHKVLALLTARIIPLQAKGVGKNLKTIPLPETDYQSGGSVVWLLNRAPHPNAARVFINWLLTKEAQAAWARELQTNSRFVGVAPGNLETVVPPGVQLTQIDSEELLPEVIKTQDIAGQLIR